MLPSRSIKSLYPLALAEGEGVGTAYEYFTKRLVLRPWLKHVGAIRSIAIVGLPEKYGSSLDFFLLAQELGAQVTVFDERPQSLIKLKRSLKMAYQQGALDELPVEKIAVESFVQVEGSFDLAICSEVLQRLDSATQARYITKLTTIAPRIAIFCPNKDNHAHVGISGLGGLTLTNLQSLITNYELRNRRVARSDITDYESGYIDMPPFPPGITRTDDQREQATSGKLEAIAMWGLGIFARAEHILPQRIRRSQSHIVYALGQR